MGSGAAGSQDAPPGLLVRRTAPAFGETMLGGGGVVSRVTLLEPAAYLGTPRWPAVLLERLGRPDLQVPRLKRLCYSAPGAVSRSGMVWDHCRSDLSYVPIQGRGVVRYPRGSWKDNYGADPQGERLHSEQ